MEEPPIDWKRVALAALCAVADHESVLFEEEWERFGVPTEWNEAILAEFQQKWGEYLRDRKTPA